jgi:anti-sigma regulatory factor (Ser/Thr protein kinase)
MALSEALANAIYHGNLELSSDLKEDGTFHQEARERSQREPYCLRKVQLTACVEKKWARWVVRDEGPGFDPDAVPDPTDPTNIERPSGRGLLLIRTFMDEVHHNDVGNEITMVKRADRAG